MDLQKPTPQIQALPVNVSNSIDININFVISKAQGAYLLRCFYSNQEFVPTDAYTPLLEGFLRHSGTGPLYASRHQNSAATPGTGSPLLHPLHARSDPCASHFASTHHASALDEPCRTLSRTRQGPAIIQVFLTRLPDVLECSCRGGNVALGRHMKNSGQCDAIFNALRCTLHASSVKGSTDMDYLTVINIKDSRKKRMGGITNNDGSSTPADPRRQRVSTLR